MNGFFYAAIACVVLAGVAGFAAYQARAKRDRMLRVETTTTEMIRELHSAATEAAGRSAYSELVELDGTAEPGPKGPLTAPLSGEECVWFRQRVIRKYRDIDYDSDGDRREHTREEEINSDRSRDAFVLRDDTGDVRLVPTTSVKGARKSVSEFRAQEEKGTELSFGKFSLSLPNRQDGATLGYKYEEWILPVGTRIFVSGEAVDRNGQLEVRGPKGKEKLVISTESEEEMLDREMRIMRLGGAGAGLAGVGAVALAVIGFVRLAG